MFDSRFIIRIRIDNYELFSIPQDENRCKMNSIPEFY